MGVEQVHRTVEAVWRIESGRVVAALAGLVRDVGWAEELAQDALVAALEQWPLDGVPANPGAWLTTVGKRRAIDALRRRSLLERRVADLGRDVRRGNLRLLLVLDDPAGNPVELFEPAPA
ncbi:sigma factor [Micromonospora sp. NPDC048935]|uniref:sigma factor n=1 Tax=Micromonospora sp. NPDC048935 TaxID=3364262 RepID=UPI0037225AF5